MNGAPLLVLGTAAASVVLGGCAVVPPVSAGQEFAASGIHFQAPAGAGWHKYQDDASGIYLIKLGPGANETRSVGVHFDSLPAVTAPDAFLEYAREEVIKAPVLDRFDPRQVSFRLVDHRGYPCVLLHVSGTTARHTGLLTAPAKQNGQIVSLLCHYPSAPGRGFAAVFEYYNDSVTEGIDAEAMSFIDSVRPVAPDPKPR